MFKLPLYRSQNQDMAPIGHTWTSVHNPGHLLILLLVRRTQIHERPKTISIKKRSDMVQCNSGGAQHCFGVGGEEI